MGIFCQVNLFKSSDGAYVPGSVVSGMIKYAVDEETKFNKITVSLKGIGRLNLTRKRSSPYDIERDYVHNEEYVDTDSVILNDEKPQVLPIGSHETQFNFTLPQDIPASLKFRKNTPDYVIKCDIKYYIRIKFDRPGFFKFANIFNKEVTVTSGITPRLPMVPTICGEQKGLTQLFTSKKSIVNIKATVEKCVYKPGDKLSLNYEVNNDTNVKIKGVETKLVEVYTFKSHGGHVVRIVKDIKDTHSKVGVIQSSDTQNVDVEIPLSSSISSFDHSLMVSRDYFVLIMVILPIPHRNVILRIPVQIGIEDKEVVLNVDESPPSYWEAMSEEGKVNDDFDNEKGEKS